MATASATPCSSRLSGVVRWTFVVVTASAAAASNDDDDDGDGGDMDARIDSGFAEKPVLTIG